MTDSIIRRFLFPRVDRPYLVRVLLVVVIAFVLFRFVLIPFRVHGNSMRPTYRNGGFNFCYTGAYLFARPARQDVVTIRLAGNRAMLLKRIVALENETVEFRDGRLYVNQKAVEEPYVSGPSDWNLPLRTVRPGHVYVVGDNWSVPMEHHDFGQTAVERIVGTPLW